jgi:hypothetical protein
MGYYVPFKHMLGQGVNRAEQKLAGSDYRMVTVDFNVDPVGQVDVDEVIDKLDNGDFGQVTDDELRAFVRLLTESEEFSPTDVRSEMKAQMMTFLERVEDAEARRNERTDELGD